MAVSRPNVILLAGLAWSMSVFVTEYAAAENGPCGLETGIWAAPREACLFANRPDEATKRFGEDALLEWRQGHYRFEGANCTVFSAKLAAKQCTLRVECSYRGIYSMGEWGIELQTAEQFRFGIRPDSPIYYHCAAGAVPPL